MTQDDFKDIKPDRPGKVVDTLIDLAAKQAHTILVGSKQQLMATFVLATPKGICILGTPWQNDSEKEQMVAAVAHQVKERKAYAYSFLTEAWSAIAPPDWHGKGNLAEVDRPRNRADRREVVVAMAVDRYGARRLVRWWLDRDPFGVCSGLRQQEEDRPEEGEPSGWDSWIGNLFSK